MAAGRSLSRAQRRPHPFARKGRDIADREQELLEDIAYQEAEGPSDTYESDADAWDSMGLAEDEAEYAGEDVWAGAESEADYDGFYAEDAAEDDRLDAEGVSLDMAMADALGAEDEDEFLGKLAKGVAKFAKKAAPVIGQVARAAAPILSNIPHPYAQVGAKVADVLSQLKAEGASTEDALEAVAELAVRDRRALPVVAGLAARSMVKNRGGQMSTQQRRQAVQATAQAVQALVNQGGSRAVRALPKIARSVKRVTASKGTPVVIRPKVLQRTIAKVASRPQLVRRLAQPSLQAQRIVQAVSGQHALTVRGPATISISIT